MADKIFLIDPNKTLQELEERPYANEDLLQRLLKDYPDLLAGHQMNEANPRRWLLVAREMGIPGEANAGDRWSLDHLFLDQDGIPTLVEVKRASDTRIRREVVGQMLDYAANAILHWPLTTIRERFEHTCEMEKADPAEKIAALIETNVDDIEGVEAFWETVQTNLRAGKLRLVFVADRIPVELRRIIEFLNEHAKDVEVLGVELRQYVGSNLRTIVPRVIGQTAAAEQVKGSGSTRSSRQWDESTFFPELERRHGAVHVEAARQILHWANKQQLRIWWGRGKGNGSFVPTLDYKGVKHQLFAVYTYGTLEVYFQYHAYKPPFDAEEKRLELMQKLNTIPGVQLEAKDISRRPNISLAVFADPRVRQQLFSVYEWFLEEIRRTG